jgi:uncharacterized damage-inducible protein DinB
VDVAALLTDLFGRVPPLAREVVEDLDLDQLTRSPKRGANTIAWLVWHIARVQDHYFAEYLGEEQLWVTGDWAARFGLSPDPANSGYGHTAKQVAAVRPQAPEVLTAYLDAVHERALRYVGGLRARDLDRIVDRSWDPPVTLGVRLVSVADDALQHVGQAAYVRGLLGA